MTVPTLTANQQIATATDWGMANTDIVWMASQAVGLPFYAACALLEKESKGRNIYGHDVGGVFSVPKKIVFVTAENYHRFIIRVMNGEIPNGVGPCQITWAGSLVNGHRNGGFFKEMSEQQLMPWMPFDNMRFGFAKLKQYHDNYGTWVNAGRVYNGALAYGQDLSIKVGDWVRRVGE
jgi:hypothetical protein